MHGTFDILCASFEGSSHGRSASRYGRKTRESAQPSPSPAPPAGYRVCINYNRSGPAAEELAAEIAERRAVTLSAVQADVGDSGAVETMFRTVDERLGARSLHW
jgi:hypothetical protein